MEYSLHYDKICRNVVRVSNGSAWIAYICMGGSGCSVKRLDDGDSWIEGVDELIGVYPSEAEADEAINRLLRGSKDD